jgi:hypothetical protein
LLTRFFKLDEPNPFSAIALKKAIMAFGWLYGRLSKMEVSGKDLNAFTGNNKNIRQ